MPDRFSADEARAIFERAARRQHAAPAPDGLSLEDLMAIGHEAGLDPALVAAEAAGIRVGDRPQKTWHGVPVGTRRSRLLPARLTDAEWERVVDALRAEFKLPGVAEQIGTRREWATMAGALATRVTVERRDDADVVTVEVPDQLRTAGLALGGIMGALGATFAVVRAVSAPEAFLVGGLFVLLATLLYAIIWGMAKLVASKAPTRVETLLDRIDLISRSDDARTQGAPAEARPALDLGRLGDALPEAGRGARARPRVR